MTIGTIVAGIASIVLFRKYSFLFLRWAHLILLMGYVGALGTRPSRVAFTSFGLGIGVGDAYRVSHIAFEREKSKKTA
jgi:hypothetical protein